MRLLSVFLALTAGLHAADLWTWWVDPCTGAAVSSGCNQNDEELARWAFEGWQRESGNRIVFQKSASAKHARLTVHWASNPGLYGETRGVVVDGKPGAELFILSGSFVSLFLVSLLRDTIVFLTFVNETGHALGLRHTANFQDFMYSFQYGGDIDAYFNRYRKLIQARPDIAKHSGVSDGDRLALQAVISR